MKTKTEYKSKSILKKDNPDEDLISFINSCHEAGNKYREKFKTRWDHIESQIRCVHPSAWEDKEDWQTKVFIPQQAKTSETAQAYLDKMLYGQKSFFDIQGVETRDKEEEGYLKELYENVFDRGKFAFENDFVLSESCSGPGTSFLKILVNPRQTGLRFVWRSAYNIIVDPECGHKLSSARYIIDEYKKSISDLIKEVESGESIYSKESIQKLLDKAEEVGRSKTEEALATVKGFDGTSVTIATDYLQVNLREFWGCVKKMGKDKKSVYSYEDRMVTVVNETVVLRDVLNDYGFIPIFSCRIKPRKYDFYGLGFCDNTVDLQELTNSMINLGFDSLKICSMDIIGIDENKVKDPASIEYRPLAVWKFKGNPREAMNLTRQGISALNDIMNGLTLLDQFQQEATGVLRQIQGSQELSGGGGDSGTLGEYQAKLAMIDNRFLKIARFIERDYIEPVLQGVFKILFNPRFFNQAVLDRILGMKEVSTTIINPMTGQPEAIKTQVSKLDFQKIASIGEMGYDFKAVGMTQFTKAIETLQKLKELLLTVVKTPQLMIMSKVDEIYKRVLQAAEIQDYSDLIKSDEEIDGIMNQIYGGQQQQMGGQPGPMGQPAGPMQGGI